MLYMRTHSVAISLTLCSVAVLLWGCFRPDPIRVGYTGQLTGKFSDLGVQGRNGAQLALEHINQNRGIEGRPLLMVAADDGNTPEGARQALDRLHDQGVFLVIGNMTSSQTLAALPHAEELGMTLVSPTSSSPLLEDKVDAHFRVISSSDTWSAALGRYASEAGNKTVIGIYDQDNAAYSKTFLDFFLANFIRAGGVSNSVLGFQSSAPQDWVPLMDMINHTRPDALVVSASARDTASIAVTLRSKDIDIPIYTGPWAFTEDLIRFGGQSAEGIVSALSYSPDSTAQPFTTFRTQYKARFGRQPGFAAAFSYEAMLVAGAALRKTSGKALGLRKTLTSLAPIKGVNGTFNLDTEGDTQRPSYVLKVQHGKFITVGRYEAP